MNTPLTWNKFIERAEERGYFSRRAKKRVREWPTCVVGEIPDALTFDHAYRTVVAKDSVHNLGIEFMRVVQEDKVATARKVYHRIRAHAKDMGWL